MKNTMFTFEQIDGKWASKLNPKWSFEMFSVHGFPVEMQIEELNNMDAATLSLHKLESWKQFTKENNIDITPYQKDYENRKDEMMPVFEQLFGHAV